MFTPPPAAEVEGNYVIHASRIEGLKAEFKRLNRRAARLGVPEVSFSTVRTIDQPEIRPSITYEIDGLVEETGRILTFHEVAVHGEPVKVAGWEVAAVIERVEGEGAADASAGAPAADAANFLRISPLYEGDLPQEFRTAGPERCDHCRLDRRRKSSFVLHHEDGRHQVVGSTCLGDFLGHDPNRLARYAEIVAEAFGAVRDEEEGWDGSGSADYGFSVTHFLTLVACKIRVHGWISRKAATDSYIPKYATADDAWDQLIKGHRGGGSNVDDSEEQDEARAQAALAWAEEHVLAADPDTLNDYLFNLRVALTRPIVYRTRGVAASLIVAAEREMGKLAERKARAEQGAQSEFVGHEKQRLVIEGTVVMNLALESAWGTSNLIKLVTAEGNVIVWFASNPPLVDSAGGVRDLRAGDVLGIKATIKRHEIRDGIKQTQVTRSTVLGVIPQDQANQIREPNGKAA